MTAQKYRKKPVVIEAIQFTGDNVAEIWDAFGADGIYGPTENNPLSLILTTVHGDEAPARTGDWVIPDGKPGTFYPCKPDIFAATYDAVRRVVPRTDENFPFVDTATSISIGRFGDEGRYACAFGHINRAAFAAEVNREQDRGNGEEAFHADYVNWCWAVVEIDDERPEDHDFRTTIRWTGIDNETEHSFPVTVLDTTV